MLFDLPKNGVEGDPDGLTVDTEGKVWLAVFRGATVRYILVYKNFTELELLIGTDL